MSRDDALQRLRLIADSLMKYSDDGAFPSIPGPSSGQCMHIAQDIHRMVDLLRSETAPGQRAVAEHCLEIAHTYRGVGDAAPAIEDAIRAYAATLPVSETAATERDAARYRWLRDTGVIIGSVTGSGVAFPMGSWQPDSADRQNTDAAIDAAMRRNVGEEKQR